MKNLGKHICSDCDKEVILSLEEIDIAHKLFPELRLNSWRTKKRGSGFSKYTIARFNLLLNNLTESLIG